MYSHHKERGKKAIVTIWAKLCHICILLLISLTILWGVMYLIRLCSIYFIYLFNISFSFYLFLLI